MVVCMNIFTDAKFEGLKLHRNLNMWFTRMDDKSTEEQLKLFLYKPKAEL